MVMCVKLKKEKKAKQFPQDDLEHISTVFKENIINHFDILNISDGEPRN